MDTLFYLVLNMSITGVIVGAFPLFLRSMGRLPRSFIYALWVIVFLRFIIPAALPSSLSVMNIAGGLIKKNVPVSIPMIGDTGLTVTNAVGAAKDYFPVSYRNSELDKLFKLFQGIWLIGLVIALLILVIRYYLTIRELKGSSPVGDNIFINDSLTSPIVNGILKQRIYLPSLVWENKHYLRYVLSHEEIHIKRQDNRIKLLAILICCIHWFNPIAWMYVIMFFNDMETSCDLAVVKRLDGEERRQYARVLFELGTSQSLFMTMSFGKSGLRKRILNIMSYKRLSLWAIITATLFILCLVYALITNPII